MAVNRDLSKFANHIFNHEDGSIGLSTNSATRIGIGTDSPRAKLDVDGDVRVSGISTFKSQVFFENDVSISGSAVYTGITTFSDANVSELTVDSLTVTGQSTLNSLDVTRDSVTYQGTLTGISTNIITDTSTTNIEVGDEVSGDKINPNTTVASIGSSAVTLSQNTTNNITILGKSGVFESANGDVIVGIDTSNIVVGYGISNQYITQGTTISSIGINSVTVSQSASNTYSKLIKTGTLSGVSTNIISGIDTTGIQLNQRVVGDFLLLASQTAVSAINVGEIVLSANASNTGVHTASYEIYFIDNFDVFSLVASFTGNYEYAKPASGIATVYNLNGTTIDYTSGTIDSLTGQTLNYANATATNLNSTTLNAVNLDATNLISQSGIISSFQATSLTVSGISTVDAINGSSVGFDTGYISSLVGTNIDYTGIGTIANIRGENISYTGVSTFNIVGASTITADDLTVNDLVTATTLNVNTATFQGLDATSAVISNLVAGDVSYNTGVVTSLSGTNIDYTGVGTIANIQGETLSYTGIATFSSDVNIDSNLSVGATITATDLNVNSVTSAELEAVNAVISNITAEEVTYNIGVVTSLSGTNIAYVGVGTITNIQGETLSYTGLATFSSDVNFDSNVSVGETITATDLNVNSATIQSLDAPTAVISNLVAGDVSYNTGVVTSLSGTNIHYTGVGTIANIQGENISYTGVSTFNTVGASTITVSDLNVNTITVESDLIVSDLVTGIVTATLFDGNAATFDSANISHLTGENLNYSGVGTFSDVETIDLNSTSIVSENINVSGVSTIANINSTQIVNSDNLVTNNLYSNVGVITNLTGNQLTYTVSQLDQISGTNVSYSGVGTIATLNSNLSTITNLNGENSNFSGVGTVQTLMSAEIVNSSDVVSNRVFANSGVVTTLSGTSIDYTHGTITNIEGSNINFTGIATIASVTFNSDVTSLDSIQGNNASFSGISTFNVVGVTSLTSGSIFGSSGIITALSGETLSYSENASLANVRIGIGYTDLVVEGNAKVTGILTVGNGSVTIDGINNEIVGVETLNSNVGIITTLSGTDATYTNVNLDKLAFAGLNTSNNYNTTVNITPSQSGFATSYNFVLPAALGIPGQVLTLQDTDGTLGFSTAGLYENRIYVSPVSGDDSNDGKAQPVKTIKRAAQLASFESFVLPGSRYADAGNLLLLNKSYISKEVVGFVTATHPGITTNADYDPVKCERDIGLIVDALYYDLTYGGNSKSVEAGLSYWSGATNYVDGEKTETIDAYKHIVTISQYVINNVALPDTINRFNDGSNLLILNKSFIQEEVVGFVTSTYPGLLSNPDYDETKCRRDVGLIVDAITYDLAYGGNRKSVEAGLSYWSGATNYVSGETTETIAAYNHIVGISSFIINNTSIPTSYQSTVTQQFDNTISYDDSCSGSAYDSTCCANVQSAIANYVGIITSIIGVGTAAAPTLSQPTGSFQPESGQTFQSFDLSISYDSNCGTGNSYSANCCADVFSAISNYVGIVTSIIGIGTTAAPTLSQPTSKSTPVAVFVEAGEYIEDNPILMYEDVAIIGDNLRNTIIRPQNAGKDLFRLRNGCYLTGFAMKDSVDAAGIPQFTFDNAVAFDDPSDTTTSRTGYAIKTDKPIITRSPYIQNCSILSFLGANGVLVDGSKVDTLNTPIVRQEGENPVEGEQPEQGKSMVAAAFTMVSFGGIGWRVINDGYSQVVSCFQIFCRYGSLAQSGGYLSITNSATNFGFYALRSTGFNFRSYTFDRGIVASTGTSGGLQTLKVVGLGRSDQELYVLKFFDHALNDQTSNFKLASVIREVDISVGVNTVTDVIGIQTHGFNTGDSIIYLGNENTIPKQIIGGLVNLNEYFAQYISDDEFSLYEDDSLTRKVDLTSVTSGINTFIKGNQEFFNFEKIDAHTSYQRVSFASTTSNLTFITGREVTQTVNGGTAVGFAVTYNSTENELLISVEASGGVRNNFGVTGVGLNEFIQDHSSSPVSAAATSVVGVTTFHTIEFKVDSTQSGSSIIGISALPENYRVHFHRPSIVNSSSHTWEYSGSGIDYNALPQNGGKTDTSTEQVFSQGGRVYSSGTNELGDFKIGNFITAFNRTGNIVFNNKVSIGQLDSLRLSLSGGVAVEEFSVDIGLGDNEIGGAQDFRVSTQKAVRTFLNNRLGNFIDKEVSTNAVPSAVVQLNAFGQINADLIPPKVVNYFTADVGGGRTTLVDRIPAVDLKNGDTVIEPGQGFVLISDVYSQFLILDDNTRDYNFDNGDVVVSAVSDGGAIGIVTHPTSAGYGNTGLVKGVALTASVIDGGSGYTNPGIYTSVLLNNSVTGAGVSANATITVGASGTVTQCSIVYGGRYYAEGNTVSVTNPTVLGGRSGGSEFQARIDSVETRLYIELTNNQKFTGSSLLSDYIADGDAVGISTTLTDQYQVTFTPNSTATGGDVDFTNDRLVIGANEFADGDPILYSAEGGNTLESLISGNTYYVKRIGISSVELYTTYALSTKVDFLSNGTGTHSITRKTVNTITDQITFINHGYTTGDAVRVSGNTPTGINTGSFYFVGSVTTNSFSLHPTQSAALSAVNGLIFNPVNITAVGTGSLTLTKQNVEYSATVNTSSSLLDNWTVLASGSVDAANITSGTISPSRLGSGTANSDTFLGGDSIYRKAVKSVGIGTTTPLTIVADSFEIDGDTTKYFGDLEINLIRVASSLENFSSLGVAKFKSSTFEIGDDGAVSIKNSQIGDIDAASLGGFSPAYYLDISNSTGSLPIARGGTGLNALPSSGFMLVGNGSAYTLTGSPTIAGRLTGSLAIPANGDIELSSGTWTGDKSCKIQNSSNNLYLQFTTNLVARNSGGTNRLILTSGGDLDVTGEVRGSTLKSDVANGTAPIEVTSTTRVLNLNADLLDGFEGSQYLRSDTNDTFTGTLTYGGTGTALNFSSTSEVILADHSSNSTTVAFDIRKSGTTMSDSSTYGVLHLTRTNHNNSATGAGAALHFRLKDSGGTLREYAGISGQKTEAGAAGGQLEFYRYDRTVLGHWNASGLYIGGNEVWNAGNDGSGSGLDADTVDGLQATSLLRSDADDTFTGTITGNILYLGGSVLNSGSSAKLQVNGFIRTGGIFIHSGGNTPNNTVNTYRLYTRNDGTLEWGTSSTVGNNSKIWHSTNDGSGSGLDADLLDNLQSTQFLRSDTSDTVTGGSILNFQTSAGNTRGHLQATDTDNAHFIIATSGGEDISFRDGGVSGTTNMTIRGDGVLLQGTTNTIWHAGNDGSGSGLDADTVDGIQASSFLRSDANDTTTGYLGAEGFVGMGGGALRLTYPHGASYATTTSSVTGAIKITLPVSWTDTMLRMTIKIYEYSSGESFEVVCGGYNYGSSSTWINVFGYIISDPGVGRDFNIRFGHDGSKCCIYIGETNSTWSYPQVAVTEFIAGYNNYGTDTWNDGWSISFATSLGTITQNISQNQVGKYVDGNTSWHAGNDGSGSGLDADTVDGLQASSFLRSDADDNTTGKLVIGGNYSNNAYNSVSSTRLLFGGGNDPDNYFIGTNLENYNGNYTKLDLRWHTGIRMGAQPSYGGVRIFNNEDLNTLLFSVGRGDGNTRVESGSLYIGGNTAWHAGNDGAGSGLDADTVDGYQFLSTQGISAVGNFGQWQGHSSYTNFNSSVNYWGWNFVQGTSNAPNSTSSQWYRNRVSLGSEYGLNYSSNHYWLEMAYPRSSRNSAGHMWVRTCENGSVGSWEQVGSYIAGNVSWHAGNDGSGSGLDADTVDGIQASSFLRSDTNDTATGTLTVRDIKISAGYHLQRSNHHSGHLEGSYNNVGANSYKTNPIYSIGSSYNPNDATLNNFYGIGYSHTNASFINFTGAGGWGMYVAADGDARVYLDGSNGVISSTGQHYVGSNVVWNAGNDGSGSGLDADLLDGLHVHGGRNNEANKVVRTDGNGYIQAGWINTTSGNATSNTPDRFYGSYDGYVRYYNRAYTQMYLGNTYKYSTSRRQHTTDSNYWVGTMGWGTTNLNDVIEWGSGFWDSWSNPANQPSGTSHWVGLNALHYTNGTNTYGWQLTVGAGNPSLMYVRGQWGSSPGSWYKVWNQANDGSGSGLDADTVDGIQGASFLRSDANDNLGGVISYHSNTARLQFRNTSYNAYLHIGGWTSSNNNNISRIRNSNANLHLDSGANGNLYLNHYSGGTIYARQQVVWHAGNDGAGSGLDADNLDGRTWDSSGKNVRATEFYADNWFRNYNSGEGMYNQTTQMHWYSDSSARWRCYSTSNTSQILFTTSGNTPRGYVYADNGNNIGFLDSDGNWAVRVVRDSYVELRDNNEVTFTAGQGGHGGNYGTVSTHGSGRGGWEGYSINSRYVLMSDDNETCGWYNDIDNEWIVLYERNDYLDLYDPDGGNVWLRMDNGEMYSYIHNRFTDNDEIRLGAGADFRMWHNGSNHYFRNYNHGNGNIYWQGEDNEGTNHALLYMITDGSRPYIRLYENGGERLRTTSGGVTVYGNLNSTSDERYKKNIEPIDDALNKIDQLEGVTFDWNNDAFPEGNGEDDNATSKPDFDRRATGVIAQSVEKVLPEAVTEDSETGMKNVAYGNMIGLLIEGIKEMNEKLSSFEDRLNKLEGNDAN